MEIAEDVDLTGTDLSYDFTLGSRFWEFKAHSLFMDKKRKAIILQYYWSGSTHSSKTFRGNPGRKAGEETNVAPAVRTLLDFNELNH